MFCCSFCCYLLLLRLQSFVFYLLSIDIEWSTRRRRKSNPSRRTTWRESSLPTNSILVNGEQEIEDFNLSRSSLGTLDDRIDDKCSNCVIDSTTLFSSFSHGETKWLCLTESRKWSFSSGKTFFLRLIIGMIVSGIVLTIMLALFFTRTGLNSISFIRWRKIFSLPRSNKYIDIDQSVRFKLSDNLHFHFHYNSLFWNNNSLWFRLGSDRFLLQFCWNVQWFGE